MEQRSLFHYLYFLPMIQSNEVLIRHWQPEDASQLASICNNKKIWLNVRDNFPYPYTLKHAIDWIAFSSSKRPTQSYAVVYNGEIAGSIGVIPKEDVYRKSIELGYFIGEKFWGKGIATRAVALLLDHIVSNFNVVRIYAEVYAHNVASMKVLEKNGFYLEGIRKKSVFKNNEILDDCIWVKLIG